MVDIFYTCFKRRENHGRVLIWLVIFALASAMFVMGEFLTYQLQQRSFQIFFWYFTAGSATLFYLFMRDKFGWMIVDYTFYNIQCYLPSGRKYFWNLHIE